MLTQQGGFHLSGAAADSLCQGRRGLHRGEGTRGSWGERLLPAALPGSAPALRCRCEWEGGFLDMVSEAPHLAA